MSAAPLIDVNNLYALSRFILLPVTVLNERCSFNFEASKTTNPKFGYTIPYDVKFVFVSGVPVPEVCIPLFKLPLTKYYDVSIAPTQVTSSYMSCELSMKVNTLFDELT